MDEKKPEIIQYKPQGTCSQMIYIAIFDNMIIDMEIVGGCHGNLQGIKNLLKGCPIDFAIERLSDIKCGDKPSSCPDQIAQCLVQYKNGQYTPVKQQ